MVVVLRREWLSHGHDATSRSEFIAKPLEKKTMVADARAVLLYQGGRADCCALIADSDHVRATPAELGDRPFYY